MVKVQRKENLEAGKKKKKKQFFFSSGGKKVTSLPLQWRKILGIIEHHHYALYTREWLWLYNQAGLAMDKAELGKVVMKHLEE